MSQDGNNSDYENMNINIIIGNILFNISIDSSFFNADDDYSFPYHNHGSYEVHFTVKGKGGILIGEENLPLSENVCCLIAPNVYHTQLTSPDSLYYKYCMKFNYRILKNERNMTPAPEIDIIEKILAINTCYVWHDKYYTIDLIQKIQIELEAKKTGFYSMIQSYFMQIIINMIRSISEKTDVNYGIGQKTIDDKRTIIIESFFYQTYMKNVHIDDLAKQLGVCKRQVNRIIMKYFKTSFKEKLINTRIEVAKSMLSNTQTNISDISEKVGYNSSSNFSNIFKKKTGISPEEHRLRFNYMLRKTETGKM